jgi:hypothetical protein
MKPRGDNHQHKIPRINEERFLHAARQYVSSAYPNPDRIGCPDRGSIEILARRDRPPSAEETEHITTCSPCFIEYSAVRQAWKRRRLLRMAASIAAALLVVAVSLVLSSRNRTITKAPAPVMTAEAASDVDMRPFSPTRGESNNPSQSEKYAGILSRKRCRLNVILPVGAEEGNYEVRLMGNDMHSIIASGKAPAAFVDHSVRLTITFDLSEAAPGPYVVALRRDDGGWMTSPVLIR